LKTLPFLATTVQHSGPGRARKGKVFNTLKRPKLLRKEIPVAEAGVGVGLVVALVVMTTWVALQQKAYDPAERDVSMAVLEQDAVRDTLYKAPLQRWRDPALAGAAGPAPVDLGVFPAAVLADGWTGARPETFTPDTLYEKINGQAEQYVKFNFQRLDVVTLTHPSGLEIDLFLYDQGDVTNALGLYEEQRGERPVETLAPGVHVTPGALGGVGVVGRCLVHVIATEEGAATRAKTTQLFTALGELVEAAATPLAYQALSEGLGLPVAQVGYQPVNVFQFGFARAFWFGRLKPGEDARVFVHQAGSGEEAAALFKRLVAEQTQEDYETLDAGPAHARLKHGFLGTVFALEVEGSRVYGVERAADETAARAALDALREALRSAGDGAPGPDAAVGDGGDDEQGYGDGDGGDDAEGYGDDEGYGDEGDY
jgi:hypothetical protein